MYIGLQVHKPLFLWDFNEPYNFLDIFSENYQTRFFMKIRPVVAKIRVERQTYKTKSLLAILRKRLKDRLWAKNIPSNASQTQIWVTANVQMTGTKNSSLLWIGPTQPPVQW